MTNSDIKNLVIGVVIIGSAVTIPIVISQIDKDRKAKLEAEIQKDKLEADIQIAEIKKNYPPEYWLAEKAKTEAKANETKLKLESEERLEIDNRERKDKEAIRRRAFEQNAPDSYWAQKKVEAEERTKQAKIEAEERTKRELNRQRFESEKAAAKAHSDAIKESARIAEKALYKEVSKHYGYLV